MKIRNLKFRLGIRVRLMIAIVVPSLIIILILTGIYGNRERSTLQTEYEKRVISLAKILAHSSQVGVLTADKSFLDQPFSGIFESNKDLKYAAAYDLTGNAVISREEGEDMVVPLSIPTDILTQIKDKPISLVFIQNKLMVSYEPIFQITDEQKELIGVIYLAFSTKYIDERSRATKKTGYALFVTFFIICIIIALFFSHILVTPIKTLVQRFKEFAQGEGDLTKRIEKLSNDELGDLGEWFNIYLDNTEKMVRKIKGISKSVLSFAENLSASSEEMSASTEEISSTIQEISEGMNRQTVKVKESNDLVSQFQDTAKNIAENSRITNEMYKKMSKIAIENRQDIDKSTAALMEIKEVVENSAKVIMELNDLSQQIGNFVNTIKAIANQTNLLSLNASIEAARAGEAGRGFGVVAEQIKKLATESAEASEEVETMIEKVQEQVEEVVGTMAVGAEKVKGVGEMSKRSKNAMQMVMEAIANAKLKIEEIESMTSNQVAGIEQIVESITEISAIAEEGAAGTEEASASTEEQAASMEELAASALELSNIARELKAEFEKFTTKVDLKEQKFE
ncbi:methyl-accepting chemotaxis protein [Candidatus Dependentiae bacterium]|nr:methyl-accepting chemotaxis protein [Candidatus Dependentiae bacterium]